MTIKIICNDCGFIIDLEDGTNAADAIRNHLTDYADATVNNLRIMRVVIE